MAQYGPDWPNMALIGANNGPNSGKIRKIAFGDSRRNGDKARSAGPVNGPNVEDWEIPGMGDSRGNRAE